MYTKIDWPTVSLIGAGTMTTINVGASMNLYSYLAIPYLLSDLHYIGYNTSAGDAFRHF